jgi:hypothetical protein
MMTPTLCSIRGLLLRCARCAQPKSLVGGRMDDGKNLRDAIPTFACQHCMKVAK